MLTGFRALRGQPAGAAAGDLGVIPFRRQPPGLHRHPSASVLPATDLAGHGDSRPGLQWHLPDIGDIGQHEIGV